LLMMLSQRIEDAENFKKITLNCSSIQQNEVIIYREIVEDITISHIVYDDGRSRTHLSGENALNRIERLIYAGYDEITCESFTGVVHARIRSGNVEINLGDFNSTTDDDAMHPIKVGQADKLLAVLDILTPQGKIKSGKQRKYEQINHFIKLISDQLEKTSQKERITILDCGCGKSYLSFVMNYFLREKLGRQCYFFCIDTDSVLIEKCKEMQGALGYANMEFQVRQIMNFHPRTDIDIVCSLHACDTATDEAIALGIKSEASLLMIVPCCQSEILNQLQAHPLKAITRHGVFEVKLADLLTDAIRALLLEANGYKVTIVEFISPIHTPKNLMILAEKVQPRNSMALEQYQQLVDMFHLSPALARYLSASREDFR
ncbi:TPA: SAM-dependent methyltransferase, partial [Candidatus Poribacteria bacterium]|nr:SAM-dependent methyltransferase [Candidatus Poribacteria bacterium]